MPRPPGRSWSSSAARDCTPTGKLDEQTANRLGSAPAPAPAPPRTVAVTIDVFPVQGKCWFGDTWQAPRGGGRLHEGVDIIAPEGNLLYAAVTGHDLARSTPTSRAALAGNGLRIQQDNGTYFTYLHMDTFADGHRARRAGDRRPGHRHRRQHRQQRHPAPALRGAPGRRRCGQSVPAGQADRRLQRDRTTRLTDRASTRSPDRPDTLRGTTESPFHPSGRVVDIDGAEGATSPESLRPTDRSDEARWKVSPGTASAASVDTRCPPTGKARAITLIPVRNSQVSMTAGEVRPTRRLPVSASASDSGPTPLRELIEPDEFVRRHVGPSPDDVAAHARRHRRRHRPTTCSAATMPSSIVAAAPLDLPGGVSGSGGARSASGPIAARNRRVTSLIGMGYTGTITPPGHRPQRAREPGLVHRLHAVPARDQPGPTRSAAQLPDAGHRAHRARRRQRLAARRGDRRRRGDDDGPPSVEVVVEPVRRPPRHPSADDRRAAHPGRAGRHRTRRRRRRGPRPRRRLFGALFSLPTSSGAVVDWTDAIAAGPRRSAGSPSWSPTCWPAC